MPNAPEVCVDSTWSRNVANLTEVWGDATESSWGPGDPIVIDMASKLNVGNLYLLFHFEDGTVLSQHGKAILNNNQVATFNVPSAAEYGSLPQSKVNRLSMVQQM